MVFRRIYGEEIERASIEAIEDDFKRELATAKRQTAWQKGREPPQQKPATTVTPEAAGSSLTCSRTARRSRVTWSASSS
jgi:hypothetical protein